MLRLTAEGIALFLVPFAIYAALLLFPARWPWLRQAGSGGHALMLATCGVGLVVLGLVLLGTFSTGRKGAYTPAHMENGKLVPGRIE